MMWWNEFIEPEPAITVDDMYKYAQDHNTPLLSNFQPAAGLEDFWKQYRENYGYFDYQFRMRYRSFCFFMQEYGDKAKDVQPDFTYGVYGLLMKNAKKYSELYRINNIDDEEYSLLDNYNMVETLDKDTSDGNTHTSKQHTDTLTHTDNAHTDTHTHTEAAYNDTDTTTTVYGAKVTVLDEDTTQGQQTDTDTGEVSAYNEEYYSDDSKRTIVNGNRSDTKDATTTEQTHTDTVTEHIDHQQHVITDQDAYGQAGATDSNQYGQHETTDAGTGHEEYTLTRKGNIGVATGTDMMLKAWNAWQNIFNFYDVIFSDIAKDLLRL